MLSVRHMPGLNYERPAPRCYSRQATPRLSSRSNDDPGSHSLVLALSIATGVAAFLFVYGGWSF
jgi:hypothetical protein